MEYLEVLQNVREFTHNFFTPLFLTCSKFILSFIPFAIFALVYWIYDKKLGFWFLFNSAFVAYINSIIRVATCTYEPWINNEKIIPVESSKNSGLGYVFPSVHAERAATFWGSITIYSWSKAKIISFIAFMLGILTFFSRNYLGVNTISEVVFGFFFSLGLVFVTYNLFFKFYEKSNLKNNLIFLIISLVFFAIGMVYISVKEYPLNYNIDGSLITDPMYIKQKAYGVMGTFISFVISYFIEKTFINFKEVKNSKLFIALSFVFIILTAFLYSKNFFLFFVPEVFTAFVNRFILLMLVIVVFPLITKIKKS